MEKKRKKKYSKPEFEVYRYLMVGGLLAGSTGGSAGLTGAGVDESDADNNGNDIW